MWQLIANYRLNMASKAPAGMEAVVEVTLRSGRTYRPGMTQLLDSRWIASETLTLRPPRPRSSSFPRKTSWISVAGS
jgi:hypothetical protein